MELWSQSDRTDRERRSLTEDIVTKCEEKLLVKIFEKLYDSMIHSVAGEYICRPNRKNFFAFAFELLYFTSKSTKTQWETSARHKRNCFSSSMIARHSNFCCISECYISKPNETINSVKINYFLWNIIPFHLHFVYNPPYHRYHIWNIHDRLPLFDVAIYIKRLV